MLRDKIIRIAHENPEFRDDLLPLVRQAGSRVSRVRGGFSVVGGKWPQSIVDIYTKNTLLFAADREPDRVEGTAKFVVKPRFPEALVLPEADIVMLWRRPAHLIKGAQFTVFDPMGRELSEFTKLFHWQSEISVKGDKFEVKNGRPARKPVAGLIQLTQFGTGGMFRNVPMEDLKRDGVMEDADVQINGARVGTVHIPKGLTPVLDDLRGLFK